MTNGPSVRVRLSPDLRGLRMEFVATRRRVRPVRLTVTDPGRVAEVRRELDAGLTGVKELLTDLVVVEDALPELARALGSLGRRLILVLLGNKPEVVRRLQAFWRTAVPAWRNSAHTPVVECLGDDEHLLPLEFLPLFDIAGCDDGVTSRVEFLRACRSFIGFSCIVRRRILPVALSGGNEIRAHAGERLVLRFLHDESLPGSRVERQWLSTGANSRVLVLGPYPDAEQTTDDLVQQLFDPSTDDVQHFSCHCDTTSTRPLDHRLQLRGAGRELVMTLGELGEKLIRHGATRPGARKDMPIVFLNACGSSRVAATSSVSFPKLFLENGNRGFLGVEIAVPDQEAAAFSVAFYRELLLRGACFGAAAHRARLHLLNTFGNPMGLAYSVYGNTDLAVTRKERRP